MSIATFQTRMDWHEVIKVIQNKDLQLRLLYPARLPFKIEGEINTLPDKKKLKESVTSKAILQDILKGPALKRRRRRRRIKRRKGMRRKKEEEHS